MAAIPINTTKSKTHLDMALILIVLALSIIGVIMVFDAGYALSAKKTGGTGLNFLTNQSVNMGLGVCAMILTVVIGHRRLRRFSPGIMAVSVVSLLLVWTKFMGQPAKGEGDKLFYRWIHIGPFKLQPSEFAKVAVILYFASWAADRLEKSRSGQNVFDKSRFRDVSQPIVAAFFVTVLVAREPDLGTAIVLFCTVLAVFNAAGFRAKHLWGDRWSRIVRSGFCDGGTWVPRGSHCRISKSKRRCS